MTTYTAQMYKDGVLVTDVDINSLNGVLAINDVGYATLTTAKRLPSWGIIRGKDFYQIDNDLAIYRYPEPYKALGRPKVIYPGTQLFVGKILDREEWEDEAGQEFVKLGIYGLNELLSRRDVDYQATTTGTGYTLKTDYADDMLKAVVYENMGAGAITARQFPADFTIAVDSSNAPSITYEFPHQNVLDVCKDIAEISAVEGTALFFDVIWKRGSALEFRTYIDQLGVDSTDRILFADHLGNLHSPQLIDKYSESYNVVNAWGAGNPGNQDKSQQEDTDLSGLSRYGRREYSFNAGNMDSTALAAAAKAELRNGRPYLTFTCGLLEHRPLAVYGIHWRFGDKVRVTFSNRQYDGLISNLEFGYDALNGETAFRGHFRYIPPGGGGGSILT